MAVGDVFDALTSVRPYKPAWPIERALDFLREQSGRHFWPDAVTAFESRLEEALAIRDRWRDESP